MKEEVPFSIIGTISDAADEYLLKVKKLKLIWKIKISFESLYFLTKINPTVINVGDIYHSRTNYIRN